MVKRILVIMFIALSLVSMSAFAEGQSDGDELEKVDFQLNWKITGNHAAYYVALEKGWFEENGLDVNIIIGQGSGYTVQALDTGKADIGIADAPVAVSGRTKGAEVTIVGILFDQHPNSMFFWKDSGITEPQDIVGKTVAVPAGDGHMVMWPAWAKQIGVDPDSVDFVNIEPSAKIATLASRQADVVFELYTSMPFYKNSMPPEEVGNILWSDYGFDVYAHSIVGRDAFIEENPEAVQAFLDAAYRGWQFALENPREAIEILNQYHPINVDDYTQNLETAATFFQTDRYRDMGIGYIDPDRIQATIDVVDEYLGAEVTFSADEMYDDSMMPDPMYKYDF